jgi:hypothetical protein
MHSKSRIARHPETKMRGGHSLSKQSSSKQCSTAAKSLKNPKPLQNRPLMHEGRTPCPRKKINATPTNDRDGPTHDSLRPSSPRQNLSNAVPHRSRGGPPECARSGQSAQRLACTAPQIDRQNQLLLGLRASLTAPVATAHSGLAWELPQSRETIPIPSSYHSSETAR